MNKRRKTSDNTLDFNLDTMSGTSLPKKKLLTRHMYTVEQQRFVWYHRDILKVSAKVAHKIFHEHYSPEVTVSVDSLNQLAGRIRRTQPPDIILAVNKESWAISPRSVASEESQLEQSSDIIDELSNVDTTGSTEPEHEPESESEPESEHDEQCAATEDHQCTSFEPADPSPPKKTRRRMYTNEEHRFVWYYRCILLMDSLQTYESFQKYFNVPGLKKANLDQLATRLVRQRDPEVAMAIHTEPWAVKPVAPWEVRPVVPKVIKPQNAEGEGSREEEQAAGVSI